MTETPKVVITQAPEETPTKTRRSIPWKPVAVTAATIGSLGVAYVLGRKKASVPVSISEVSDVVNDLVN